MGWPASAEEPAFSRARWGSQLGQEGGRRGEFLSEVELGATEERDFAPEEQQFFQDIGKKIHFFDV